MNFNEFLSNITNKTDIVLYNNIINKIEIFNVPFEQWTVKEVDEFLTSLESVSINSIQKNFNLLTNLHEYHCKSNGYPYTEISPSKIMWEYIDFEKLRSITITHEDYLFFRNELDIIYDGSNVNLRDKVILELAWETLTVDEIKNLKLSDVEEKSPDIMVLHLKNRKVNINDPVVIEDIKMLKKEFIYYRFERSGRVLKFQYKDSPYLIRPIAIRLDTEKEYVSNLAIIFMQIMKRTSYDVTRKSRNYDGKEFNLCIEKISLESIRRSKIIYLLSPKETTLEMAKMALEKSQQNDLVWLNKLARQIYG